MDSEVSFGHWLKRRRKALDFTQDTLARRVGCSLATIQKIESDERRPSRQIAELLAEHLEIPPADRETFLKVARGERRVDRLPIPPLPAAPLLGQARPAPRSNLPIPPTPLIGREAEMTALDALLRDPQCRLVTLVGPGGIGKTRLAIESAAAHRDAFADGVYFVPLAPLSSPEFIVPAAAAALGFSFYSPADPGTQLLNYLREKEMLLVLDNVEHLLAEGPLQGNGVELLAAILQQAPSLKLQVTSRERLNLLGEWVFELQGLPVPPADQVEREDEYSAVALFVQSARRAQAGFVLRAEERPAVARICRLAEGMPLAIELAATWVRVLSCAEIAREIERDLDFLAASVRNLPERHRSLRAVFDHSWRLLSKEERRVMGRLSVFRGGFTRQAAEQVAGASLSLLSALVTKSLVHRTEKGRYDLHALLRQYAAAHLEADPEACVAIREQHYAFYLGLAEAAGPELRGARQLEWLACLDQEHDNLRAALEWSLDGERGEAALRLAGALSLFWGMRNYFHEGCDWLMKALRRCPKRRTAARACALAGLAPLINLLADHRAACALAEESAAIYRALDDKQGLADALTVMGRALRWQGEAAVAHSRLTEAVTLYREVGDRWGLAHALFGLGGFLADFGGDRRGRALLEESSAILEELGDKFILVGLLISLGIIDLGSGDCASARARFEGSLAIAREIGDQFAAADALTNIGCVLRIQGDYVDARSHFEEALRTYQECGSSIWCTDPLCALAENDIAQGDLSTARSRLQEASALAETSENRWLQTLVSYFQGVLAYYEGDTEHAVALLEGTTALARKSQYMPDLARSLSALGRVRRARGDAVPAEALLKESLSLYEQLNHKHGIATALEGLAGLAVAENTRRAARLFAVAEAMRAAIGAPIPPVDRPSYESDVAATRAQLDEAAFVAAWDKGQATPWETVVDELLTSETREWT